MDESPFQYKLKVVVLKKSTKWSFLKSQHPGLCEYVLEDLLRSQGQDVDMLRRIDEHHRWMAQQVVDAFKKLKCSSVAVTMESLPGYLHSSNVVIACGGDGTVLSAASMIREKGLLLLGHNSDPEGSEGFLCAGGKNPLPPSQLARRVVEQDFSTELRSRIRMVAPNSRMMFALNDVFIANEDPGKVSTFEITIDEEDPFLSKNSGVLTCTGSGSTAWWTNMMRLEKFQVKKFLKALKESGDLASTVTDERVNSLYDAVNATHTFSKNSPRMGMLIREPVFSATFPPTEVFATPLSMTIKSICNAKIIVDGSRDVMLPYGAECHLTILPKDAIYTIKLD